MRIHAVQTGTVAVRPSQVRGQGQGFRRQLAMLTDRRWTAPLPIYAWVVEHPEGLIVIDTGETARASTPGYFTPWHPYYKNVREWVSPDEEIGPRLRSLGLSPDDVRWVVMTHLHTDHAGGLAHFPRAEILVTRREYELARGFMGQVRGFLPQRWPSWFAPRLIDLEERPCGPFPASLPLTRAGDVTVVPTNGHTAGHASVILEDGELTYFFAGDTSYTEGMMLDQQLDGVTSDEAVGRATLGRILQFVTATPTVYLPSHDPGSVVRLAERRTVAVGSRT